MVCRAQHLVLRISLGETVCEIGNDEAIRRATDDGIECRLSNPQLRIITLFPDNTFTYLDTDSDKLFRGSCAAN